MLTAEEKNEIAAEFYRYEQKSAVGVEALQIVQRHRGWVADDALVDVAEFLEMTPAELEAVATFYNLIFRKPVGRHIILVCDSVSCWIMGYDLILQHLQDRLAVALGGTSSDGVFTLLPIVCLGACDQAPAMMIDDRLYGNLNPAKIDEILATYR
jgi:NADH-quinone oxidoreductase subunit E